MSEPVSDVTEERPKQKPPGLFAWGTTAISLSAPVLGTALGWIGVSNHGNDIQPWLFFTGFGLLVLSAVLSFVVHIWGMVRAFYPKISAPWITICLLGIVSGCLTVVAGVLLMMRLYGA